MKKFTLIAFSFIFTLFSYEKPETITTTTATINTTNDISQQTAVDAAQSFLAKYHASTTARTQDIVKTIESVYTYKTTDDKNAFYAINYEEGGFTVVSADDRVSPILAFSEEGKFSNNIDEIPDPVVSWIEEERESIKDIKDSNLTQLPEIHLEWDYLLTTSGNPNLCETLFLQKGPLLQTEWGQGEGFNNLIPYPCASGNGHVPAGCVPVAMAQVMKYYQ